MILQETANLRPSRRVSMKVETAYHILTRKEFRQTLETIVGLLVAP
jgi:hypothetical protein